MIYLYAALLTLSGFVALSLAAVRSLHRRVTRLEVVVADMAEDAGRAVDAAEIRNE